MSAARASSGRSTILLLAILAIAALLRLTGLATLPFDQDELYTLRDATDLGARAAQGGLPGIAARPVYFLMQHALLDVLPPTELHLRILPFVFGLAGVWITWKLAGRHFGVVAAAVASFLVAISPWHLYASQFARYWTLVYLLAAAVYLVLPDAIDSGRPRALLATALMLVVGVLTHPTFAFPMVGFVLALHLADSGGRIGWRWPSRAAWLWLWLPAAVAVGLYAAFLALRGQGGAAGNGEGRGLDATLRLVPAMVQWMSPVIAAAALAGCVALLRSPLPGDRRWGACILAGTCGALALLVLAATRTDVYADYGMAALPLVFLAVGAGVARLADLAPARSTAMAVGAVLILAAGVLPETVSHLSDGTRFDYRPAYRWLERHGNARLVVGWPVALQRAYGKDLRFEELKFDRRYLEDTLAREEGFWLVASYHRRGLIQGGSEIDGWIRANCRTEMVTERPRLDYRTYRVVLSWCGATHAVLAGSPP